MMLESVDVYPLSPMLENEGFHGTPSPDSMAKVDAFNSIRTITFSVIKINKVYLYF